VGWGTLFLLASGLAMDATAVAASKGLAAREIRPRDVLLVAILFGGFQALMPAVGWALGTGLGAVARSWDHWVAFVLLSSIGGKMAWESWLAPLEEVPSEDQTSSFGLKATLMLAIATSIDALAAGISLPVMNAPFLASILTIGLVTAAFSAAGLFAGRRFGAMLGRRLDALGGFILIGIGIKILAQHLG
jgi:manganese efflux pump family protein